MRTTITIDDELFRKAVEVADPGMDKAEIVREAMRVFVRIQSGKRLAALGGAVPGMQNIPRRRAGDRKRR
jgi:Arc/MetJ family transcription regulator